MILAICSGLRLKIMTENRKADLYIFKFASEKPSNVIYFSDTILKLNASKNANPNPIVNNAQLCHQTIRSWGLFEDMYMRGFIYNVAIHHEHRPK